MPASVIFRGVLGLWHDLLAVAFELRCRVKDIKPQRAALNTLWLALRLSGLAILKTPMIFVS